LHAIPFLPGDVDRDSRPTSWLALRIDREDADGHRLSCRADIAVCSQAKVELTGVHHRGDLARDLLIVQVHHRDLDGPPAAAGALQMSGNRDGQPSIGVRLACALGEETNIHGASFRLIILVLAKDIVTLTSPAIERIRAAKHTPLYAGIRHRATKEEDGLDVDLYVIADDILGRIRRHADVELWCPVLGDGEGCLRVLVSDLKDKRILPERSALRERNLSVDRSKPPQGQFVCPHRPPLTVNQASLHRRVGLGEGIDAVVV